MSISVTDMLYLGGVALVTGLAALLPVGLASRYSIIGVDEEAPPWVSQTWSGLHSLANGVFCTLAIELSLKGSELMCSGSSSPIGQHIASTIILLSFFIPTVINHYLHIVQEERQEKEGYTKLALPLDIIKMKLSKIARGEKRDSEKTLSLRTDLIIPKIEVESKASPTTDTLNQPIESDNGNSYVSLSDVDHSKISSQVVTPACTPIIEHPFEQGSLFPSKDAGTELHTCEPFMSLTSFDARTKPGTTFGLKFDSAVFLGAISFYHFLEGVSMGRNVRSDNSPELRPLFAVFLLRSTLVSSMASITLLTMQSNLSLKGLTCWLAGVFTLNPLGASVGFYSVPGSFIVFLCATCYCTSAGLLLRVMMLCLLARDLEDRKEFWKKIFIITLGGAFILLLSFLLSSKT